MPATAAVTVRGMRELQIALSKADRQTRLGVRKTLRGVAEPVRLAAESRALTEISNIGPTWWKMRVGVTRTEVYVAPRQRGVKRRADMRRRRPNLGSLLMDRAMQPALEAHRAGIELAVERMLDTIADDFNRAA